MPETGYLAVFLIGLLGGGTHCVSMRGGIVGALSTCKVHVPGDRPQWPLPGLQPRALRHPTPAPGAVSGPARLGRLLEGMLGADDTARARQIRMLVGAGLPHRFHPGS